MTERGYTVKQWQELRQQELSFLENAVTALAPFAGLTSNALAHLREDWVFWDDEVVRIEVPAEAECNSFKTQGGDESTKPPILVPRDKPCQYCRRDGTTDGFENYWLGTEQGATKPYTAILHRELAAPAVDVLETVFQTHARPEIAFAPVSVRNAARRLAGGQDDARRSYTKLMQTGAVLYAEYGLSIDEISRLTPYTKHSVTAIVGATPGTSFDQVTTLKLLRTVDEMGPVTAADLADRLDRATKPLRDRLHQLQAEGKMTVENDGRGPPAATWETTDSWHEPISCEECEFESHSLAGIQVHRQKMHD
jgi:hypothetical protein